MAATPPSSPRDEDMDVTEGEGDAAGESRDKAEGSTEKKLPSPVRYDSIQNDQTRAIVSSYNYLYAFLAFESVTSRNSAFHNMAEVALWEGVLEQFGRVVLPGSGTLLAAVHVALCHGQPAVQVVNATHLHANASCYMMWYADVLLGQYAYGFAKSDVSVKCMRDVALKILERPNDSLFPLAQLAALSMAWGKTFTVLVQHAPTMVAINIRGHDVPLKDTDFVLLADPVLKTFRACVPKSLTSTGTWFASSVLFDVLPLMWKELTGLSYKLAADSDRLQLPGMWEKKGKLQLELRSQGQGSKLFNLSELVDLIETLDLKVSGSQEEMAKREKSLIDTITKLEKGKESVEADLSSLRAERDDWKETQRDLLLQIADGKIKLEDLETRARSAETARDLAVAEKLEAEKGEGECRITVIFSQRESRRN